MFVCVELCAYLYLFVKFLEGINFLNNFMEKSNVKQAVVLAAGRGTRMGSLTEEIPKPMLEIAGRPKLVYSFRSLPKEVKEVFLVVSYKGEIIKKFFGNYFGGRKVYYVWQKDLNGTAGAVSLVKDLVKGRFLVLMGDDLYLQKDLEKLMKYKQAVLAIETKNNFQSGVIEVDEKGYLRAVREKVSSRKEILLNTGAYVLSQDYFHVAPVAISKKEFGLPQTLAKMYPQRKTKVVLASHWQPVGTPEALVEAEKFVKKFLSQ